MLVESALRLLGVRFPAADFKASIESAYRRLAVALHPDKGGSPEAFRLAKQARDVCVGDCDECRSWSEVDEACRRLCADPRVGGVYASGEVGSGLASSPWNLAVAKTEIANLRAQAAMAGFQRQTQHRLDEERERRLDEERERRLEAMARARRLEEERARLRRLREAELQRQQRREEERKALERRLREAEVQRQREKDLERQARESLRARQQDATRRDQEEEARGSGATEPETREFKHYVPRIWPALNPAQVKKKEAYLKQLRSIRTMRKRGLDKRQEDRVAACNRRIEVVLRDAWGLYREVSGMCR